MKNNFTQAELIETLAAEYLAVHENISDRTERDNKKAELDNLIHNVLKLDAEAFSEKLIELAFKSILGE